MTLYETNPTDLKSQIIHYQLLRKEGVLQYYTRKEGYDRLGLQYIPPLKISENHAKTAIKMILILESLAKSKYASEQWTFADCSADRFNSPPRNCLKKHSFEVEVWFDSDKQNAFPYINWRDIYYQDEKDEWHKVKGEVDYNGLFFTELDGTRNYFILFEKDAYRYGKTGTWTVNYDNEQILPFVTSSSRKSISDTQEDTTTGEPSTSLSTSKEKDNRRRTPGSQEGSPSSTTRHGRRRRRGGEQRESPPRTKRRRGAQTDGTADYISPEEVGGSHRSVQRTGLGRIERLKEEARDPPIIQLKGGANSLKCWRNRFKIKYKDLFTAITTVYKWVGNNNADEVESRLMVAFRDLSQRSAFIATVHIPKGVSMSLGSLDSL